ncbi:hypothetical protein ABZ816_29835 [Actinosynnema sp. NPDC047251]|uniref:Uncharacterized protein n=1 Tax=Saccharothrix espanaensis (strain ATCC 51144 / DSM 44229 / JCM 9112 / NBRC 15066 / NRRL 15764) TaxID=1179773 RepID=K0KD52_SACES|nr:hypothetical protein [Saccharothrix espanaensis]CCH34719.1 hypothetical protein BN6_74920 [Saccharothrix espanaensis DSM 44229]
MTPTAKVTRATGTTPSTGMHDLNAGALSCDGCPTHLAGRSAVFQAFAEACVDVWSAQGRRNRTGGSPTDLHQLGGFIGATAQSLSAVPPDQAPPPPEQAPPLAGLETAAHLGQRVAEVAGQLRIGRAA